MSDTNRSATFEIRNLKFDPETRAVDVNGRRTLLDMRASRVFLALSEKFGDSVSKEALMRAGWPSQLVHENSLAKAISKLRPAISGSGLEIAAVYGLGYSLREAQEAEPAAAAPPLEPAEPPRERVHARRVPLAILALCLVVLAALAASFAVGPFSHADPIDRTPITNDAPDAAATILWVDDHPSNNRAEVQALRQRRVAVHLAESTPDALKLLAINRYNLVVSDLGRGDDRLAGLRLIEAMRQSGMSVPVIIYTVRPPDGPRQIAQRRLVKAAGASDLAVTPEEVRASIFRSLRLRS